MKSDEQKEAALTARQHTLKSIPMHVKDDGNLGITVLVVENGVLLVSLMGNAEITRGSNETKMITISGSQADINATLKELKYRSDPDFTGKDTIKMTSTDTDQLNDIDEEEITVNRKRSRDKRYTHNNHI